jgi:NAD(P)-dependent dehydrogenase (short-subunit alcohol dehydrogenase family)
MSDDQSDVVTGVNLKGVFLVTRPVTARMIPAGIGVILNASSIVRLCCNFGQTKLCRRQGGPTRRHRQRPLLASDAASFITGAVLSVDGGVVTET